MENKEFQRKIWAATCDPFTKAYLEAMFWTNEWDGVDDGDATKDDLNGFSRLCEDEDGDTFVKHDYGYYDISEEALDRMVAECDKFQELAGDFILNNETQAGHDFWLTREGCGTGFWDRELWRGEKVKDGVDGDYTTWKPAEYDTTIQDYLTELSRAFKESYMYVGEDDKLYCDNTPTDFSTLPIAPQINDA